MIFLSKKKITTSRTGLQRNPPDTIVYLLTRGVVIFIPQIEYLQEPLHGILRMLLNDQKHMIL